MLAAEGTKGLLIGVSRHQVAGLDLRYAAFNAAQLRGALAASDGCGIPQSNLGLLQDERAAAGAIIDELHQRSASCTDDEIFILYFSGHGEREDDHFYLIAHDTDPGRLATTAVAMEEVQTALNACKARGILVVLDCCQSAGFAENADALFRTISGREFRLLLSASRSGQASFEFDKKKGTLFTDALLEVLESRAVVGNEAGIVYFSDLFGFVQSHVAEGLEALGQQVQAQEPVFAGTFSRDPRLFILNRLSLERIEAETPRYSRKFVRERIRRVMAGGAIVIIFLLACYYTYLDHSRYVWHETGVVDGHKGDFLAIYAGDPRFDWLGFPHRLVTTDILASALPPDMRPGVGHTLASQFDLAIEPRLFEHLSAEWKTAVSQWSMNPEGSGWRYANDIDLENEHVSGRSEAILSLSRDAAAARTKDLEDLLLFTAGDSSPIALRRLAFLNPGLALDQLANKDEFALEGPEYVTAVLQGLPPACNDRVQAFLEATAAEADSSSTRHDAWFGALLRTRCRLPTTTLFSRLPQDSSRLDQRLDWVGGLIEDRPPQFCERLGEELTKLIGVLRQQTAGQTDRYYQASLLLWTDIKTAALYCPTIIPEDLFSLLASPYNTVRVIAAEGLVVRDPRNVQRLRAEHASDPWVIRTLVGLGWFDAGIVEKATLPLAPAILAARSQLPITNDPTGRQLCANTELNIRAALEFLLLNVRRQHLMAAIPSVKKVIASFDVPEILVEAVRTLDELDEASGTPSASFTAISGKNDPVLGRLDLSWKALNAMNFIDDSKWWLIRHHRAAYEGFLVHLGEDPSQAAYALGRVDLPAAVRATLRSLLETDDRKEQAAAVLAMRGDNEDLEMLFQSPDINVRAAAAEYAGYNPVLPNFLAQHGSVGFGTSIIWYLQGQLKLRRDILSLPPAKDGALRALLLTISRAGLADVSPGLSLAIQDEIDSLVGGSPYLGANIDLDHLLSQAIGQYTAIPPCTVDRVR